MGQLGVAARSAQVWRVIKGTPSHPYPLTQTVPATNAWPAHTALPVPRIRINAAQAVLELELQPDELLIGAGGWQVRGTRRVAWCEDSYGRHEPGYFAVPFLISSRGYSIFVNCSGRVEMDCGAHQRDTLRITVPEPGMDVFFFRGTLAQITAAYTALVGRPRRVPAWAFTPWFSRNSYMSAAEIDHELARSRAHGIQPGVVVLECWAESLQSFTFETNRFPDPAGWIAGLHTQKVRVVLWETPSIWSSASTYSQAVVRGLLVRNADGSELTVDWLEGARKIDFRTPAACQWWRSLHEPLVALGVDGFKTDGGERMPDPFFHNLHPYYYQHAVLEAFDAQGRDGITFARAASPPCARLSTFWAGDQPAEWSFLPALIRLGLGAGVAGFPFWGHDIGGYSGTPSPELYVRWLQFGAFSPIMQLHGVTPREPWYFGEEAVRIARRYFDVRDRLQPYLIAQASNVYAHGAPLMRPLAWAFPHHTNAWLTDDAYLLGDALLIAPILTPMPRAIIPAGMLRAPDGRPGLRGEFFDNTTCSGRPAAIAHTAVVDFNWGQNGAWHRRVTDRFSARWSGTLGPVPTSGVYAITVACDDGARLWLDDTLLIDKWHDAPYAEYTALIALTNGQSCRLRLDYYEQTGAARCHLSWTPPGRDHVTRRIWLPPGAWIDAWNGTRRRGPAFITRRTPLDETPVFINARAYAALQHCFN